MTTERVDKLEKQVEGLKEAFGEALTKVADNLHELTISINESKFRDENLKNFVEQNYKNLEDKNEVVGKRLDTITEEFREHVKEINKRVNEVEKQVLLNTEDLKKYNAVIMRTIGSVVVACAIGGLTAYFSA